MPVHLVQNGVWYPIYHFRSVPVLESARISITLAHILMTQRSVCHGDVLLTGRGLSGVWGWGWLGER